ncbi:MAG: S8 family serine peptidase [Bacteroidales bacterium]|nr:S8 family serine peptidase [Bacteroidales bacterium]
MRQIVLLFLMCIYFVPLANSQVAPDKYWVQFADKNGTPYSLDAPEEFLTQRAIQRRMLQGIEFDESDLPVNPDYIQGVADAGANLLYVSKWINGLSIETTDNEVLEAIAALPYVVGTRKVASAIGDDIQKSFFANESYDITAKPLNTELKSTGVFNYGSAYTQINQINGIPLHEMGYRGQGMVIAILDGGFDMADIHPVFDSLWQNDQILGTKDFVHPGGNVFTESYHGTAVLSTIGANAPGQMIGTAPKASFWLLRSEYVYSENILEEYNWVSAAEFADSVGADVINSSLGYIDFDMPQRDHTYEDMDGNSNVITLGADMASSKGILVVNSAGNEGSSTSYPYIGAPADGFDVFSIGAVRGDGERASFSSIGPTYDGRIKPDVMAMGQGTTVASGTNSIGQSSGTSFSSPIIAGMSACLWQANPGFTNLEIKDAIMQSGDNVFNPNAYYGYGIPDYEVANSVLTSINSKLSLGAQFLKISPNPFSDAIQVKLLMDTVLQAKILDRSGREIIATEINRNNLEELSQTLRQLNPGFYVLIVSSKSDYQLFKLIKN